MAGFRGDPLVMIVYGLRVISLTRELQEVYPHVTQLWYTDDAEAGGTFTHIQVYLDNIMA